MKMTRTNYNEIAEIYDEDKVRNKNVDHHLIEYFKKHNELPHNIVKIFDMACGTGNQLIANKAVFPDIEMFGLDKFDKMLGQAKKKSKEILWIHADMDQPDLSIGEFNYISCQFAYHHSTDKKQFIKNVFHNLKEGGWFSLINLLKLTDFLLRNNAKFCSIYRILTNFTP